MSIPKKILLHPHLHPVECVSLLHRASPLLFRERENSLNTLIEI
jgi:hypothetical protein